MDFQLSEKDGILIVAPDGRLVAACSEDLKTLVSARLETTPKVVVDLLKMTHIDSSGLGALVALLQRANALGGTVKLANLQPHPRIVFDITKVYRVFEIFDSLDAALASFAK